MNALEEELRSTLQAKTDLVSPTMLRTKPETIWLDGTDRVIQLPAPSSHAEWHRRTKLGLSIAVAATVAVAVGVTAVQGAHPKRSDNGSRSASAPRRSPIPIYPAPGSSADPHQGWAVVLVRSASNPDTAPQTVYQVSPTGQRTEVAQISASYLLAPQSWNFDAGRVILQDTPNRGDWLLDLHTGKLTLIPRPEDGAGGIWPIGENFLTWNLVTSTLSVIDARGQLITHFSGDLLGNSEAVSPDGRQVAAGTSKDVTLFDAASGKALQHWTVPAGRSDCGPNVWLPNDAAIQGTCDPTTDRLADQMNFPLTSSKPTSAVLPGGWVTLRLPNGTFAFRTSAPSVYGGLIGPVDKTEIARVDADGTLHPVAAPAALHGWTYEFGSNGLIATRGDVLHKTGVASWNPISGQLSVYYTGAASIGGYAVWGG